MRLQHLDAFRVVKRRRCVRRQRQRRVAQKTIAQPRSRELMLGIGMEFDHERGR